MHQPISRPQLLLQTPLPSHTFAFSGAANGRKQPLCSDVEGWGPLSSVRYDFTPCFLDIWVAVVALYGVLFGAGAIWWLLRKSKPYPVSKDWHLYTNLVYFL